MTAKEIVHDMISDFMKNVNKVQKLQRPSLTEFVHMEGKGVCVFYVPTQDKERVIELLASMYGEPSGEVLQNYSDPLTN